MPEPGYLPQSGESPRVAFVLVEPQFEGNIGACARAMKNCGFHDLRLVRPPALGDEALRMACGSHDVLHGARHCETLAAAIADASLIVAFTARDRRDLRTDLLLEDVVPQLATAAQDHTLALLFGREDRGLTGEELAPANFLVRIPAAAERAVYNLSQAVLLAAYQLRRAIERGVGQPSSSTPLPVAPGLTAAARHHLSERLHAMLLALDYDQHPDPGLMERILHRTNRALDRAGLDDADLAMLLGVLRRIEQRAGRNAGGERWTR